ncbi:NACHT domain-containing protein [Pholiota molesta]|nr:NACHT domain-containing protein [Pholiota molesta]
MAMFGDASSLKISGGNFVMNTYNDVPKGRQILAQSRFVTHGAIHDSGERYPPSQCHPDTRKEILDNLWGWVTKPPGLHESQSQMFWLHGPAGSGKTAIAQSLCQRLKADGRLGGDIFLSRSLSGHSNPNTVFPTIAYQLSLMDQDFGREIDTIIEADESILTKNMELQLAKLIVDPVRRKEDMPGAPNFPAVPLVLVIDGLDEVAKESDQISILKLLGNEFREGHLPGVKVVITSRPEPWIRNTFDNNPLLRITGRLFLEHTTQTDDDIRLYLKFGFQNIEQNHSLMTNAPENWPSPEIIDTLIDNASGQFIYAATILRYLEDPNNIPSERLQWIMDTSKARKDRVKSDNPLLPLDQLYKQVLSTSSDVKRTLSVLGAILVLISAADTGGKGSRLHSAASSLVAMMTRQTPVTPSGQGGDTRFLGVINWAELMLHLRQGNGTLALRTIQSLVDISADVAGGVKFYHKSFPDFLLDVYRSEEYFVDINEEYSKIMMWTLKSLRSL